MWVEILEDFSCLYIKHNIVASTAKEQLYSDNIETANEQPNHSENTLFFVSLYLHSTLFETTALHGRSSIEIDTSEAETSDVPIGRSATMSFSKYSAWGLETIH